MTRKIVYLVTEDWYFWSHRIELARAARDAGYDVSVITRVRKHGQHIIDERINLCPIELPRSLRNPARDIAALFAIVRRYRSLRPDIVHHVALKSILLGSIAARLSLRRMCVVNAFTGLGFVFSSRSMLARLLRPILVGLLKLVVPGPGSWAIVQNDDDLNELTESGIVVRARARLIRGSGVDLHHYASSRPPEVVPLVVLPARMLWDKGVQDFVEAVRELRRQGVQARFALVGDSDPENPASVPQDKLRAWQERDGIEWWGWQDDMREVYSQAAVVCLPSRREGLPKALLEGAAAGRALVATDVPGCREVIEDGVNGYLVPPGMPTALAEALGRLISDYDMQLRMGAASRRLTEQHFSIDRVVDQTLTLYGEALSGATH